MVVPLKQLDDRTPVLIAPDRWRGRRRQSADRRAGRLRSLQARFMREDCLLEFPERGRRLEAKLVDQCHPRVAVSLQCLGLAPAAVEGQHQLAAQALTQRMLSHERLELADQLRVPSAGQIGVDPVFEQRELKLFEPADLGLTQTTRMRIPQAPGRATAQGPLAADRRRAGGRPRPGPRDPGRPGARSGRGRAHPAPRAAGSHLAASQGGRSPLQAPCAAETPAPAGPSSARPVRGRPRARRSVHQRKPARSHGSAGSRRVHAACRRRSGSSVRHRRPQGGRGSGNP